jgi:hypothetical protein
MTSKLNSDRALAVVHPPYSEIHQSIFATSRSSNFIRYKDQAPRDYINHAGQALRNYIDYSQPDAARLHRPTYFSDDSVAPNKKAKGSSSESIIIYFRHTRILEYSGVAL